MNLSYIFGLYVLFELCTNFELLTILFSLVDSNMFVRCATLTFHKFQSENVQMSDSRLLNYMSNKEVRANLIAKLIELITPDTLNQVISGTAIQSIFSKFSGCIL